MDRRPRHRHRVDRSRQALAEWRGGELQRQVPRRVPEPRMVPFASRGEGADRERGAGTSTRCGRIRASAISRRRSSRPATQGAATRMRRGGSLRYVGPPRPAPSHHRPARGKQAATGWPSQVKRGPKKQGRSHQMGLFMIFRQKWPRRPLRPPSRPRPAAGWPAIRVCLRRRSPRAATASPIPCPKYSTARSCRCSTPRLA